MNVENTPCELIFGMLFPSDASSSTAQQQLFILCGSLLHLQVWYSDCNAELFPLITVLKPGAKRLTIRHIDTTILTKVEENINLVVFDNSNLSSFMIFNFSLNHFLAYTVFSIRTFLLDFFRKLWRK